MLRLQRECLEGQGPPGLLPRQFRHALGAFPAFRHSVRIETSQPGLQPGSQLTDVGEIAGPGVLDFNPDHEGVRVDSVQLTVDPVAPCVSCAFRIRRSSDGCLDEHRLAATRDKEIDPSAAGEKRLTGDVVSETSEQFMEEELPIARGELLVVAASKAIHNALLQIRTQAAEPIVDALPCGPKFVARRIGSCIPSAARHGALGRGRAAPSFQTPSPD
jgi:hypothetical protein